VAAMPGRIINALCEAKTSNPLMVLDEIDKMSSDMRGDPASAMLEVLDSEQNKTFRDHFVEMDVDLSRCMFIATANSLESVPTPLIDRMEIIELSSYTKNEKLNIAKNHLIPKQLKLHGMNKRIFKITDDAIEFIAQNCDTDVRSLEGGITRLAAYTSIIVPEVIDVEFTNEALKDYITKNPYVSNDIASIQKAVADYYKLTVEVLKGKKRSANIAYPRMVAMYMCRTLTDQSFPRIGLEFGGKDHSTVIHAVDKITEDLKTNSQLKEIINEIKSKM
jgi:ATP-dependent Lon protease